MERLVLFKQRVAGCVLCSQVVLHLACKSAAALCACALWRVLRVCSSIRLCCSDVIIREPHFLFRIPTPLPPLPTSPTGQWKVKVKSSYNRPRRAQRGSRGTALLILDLGGRRGWVVSITPRPLYPRERPGTHCTGGWVGPRASLDVCEKSRPHRDSIPGPSSL
jgi:hypothetical protein